MEKIKRSIFKSKPSSGFDVQTGTQKYRLKQFPFLYESEPEFLSLYKELFDNIPIMDNAIDTYVTLINPGYTIESDNAKDIKIVDEVLKHIRFPNEVNELIQNSLIYGFSGSEIVLSSDLTAILRMKNVPSEDLRVERNNAANITNYYQINTAGSYIDLNPNRFVFVAKQATTDNVYGRSLFKALPFLTRIMLQMQDAIGKIYNKYGSPRFHVNYVPNVQLDQDTLRTRLNSIKKKFNDPKVGEDFFSAGDVDITVIGAQGEVIKFSVEMQEITQGVFSGLKLPAGVLGYNYGSTETHMATQIEVLLARIIAYQKYFASEINAEFMPLLAKVYNLSSIPSIKFDRPVIVDEEKEAKTETIKISNVTTLLSKKLISPEYAIEKLKLPKITPKELAAIEKSGEVKEVVEGDEEGDKEIKKEEENPGKKPEPQKKEEKHVKEENLRS